MLKLTHTPVAALTALVVVSFAYGDQGSFTNSGGSASASSGITVSSTVAAPAGTLTLNCPATGPTTCSGGSYSYASNDGTTTINASFTKGTFAESCSGGGKGGHVTCSYSFTANLSGTWTVNGAPEAIIGVTSQAFGSSGGGVSGTTAYNSAYTPFYYSDSEQILRSDDLQGTNQISFGSQGNGVGQFYGAYGIALDANGSIYVADTYNCRVVRMDDMNGTNWTTYGGTCGSGQGQFYDPQGIAVDLNGEIYVMDTGNSRLVRMDDMNGTNWTSFSSVGSGVGQLSAFTSVAVDSSGRIYVADSGNRRIVRMDDITGANWAVLTQSPPINGVTYSFVSPIAVAVDAAGRIYVAEYFQPTVIRVDDMTGANWTSINAGGNGLHSVAADTAGTAYTGGSGVKLLPNMAGVLNSSGSIAPFGTYYVFGVTPVPQPSPLPSAISISPGTLTFSQPVGTTSAAQAVTISNFGGSALNFGGIMPSGDFSETDNCPSQLAAGSSCTAMVTFTPSVTGEDDGVLTIADDSGNLGGMQSIPLGGTGTDSAGSTAQAILGFPTQVVNTTSTAKSVTVTNSGSGAMHVSSIAVSGPFSQTNTCGGTVAAGGACTVLVSFTPTGVGPASGTLAIIDDAETRNIRLSGSGSAPLTFEPGSLNFGAVMAGKTSAVKNITVKNRAKTPLSISGMTASAGFSVAGSTCGTSLAAGAGCTVGVTFSPAARGDVNGTLTLTDDSAASPQTVALTGRGR